MNLWKLFGGKRKVSVAPETDLDQEIRSFLKKNLSLLDNQQHPIGDDLAVILRDNLGMRFSIKHFGYEMARVLQANLAEEIHEHPGKIGLQSKASTQNDIESNWLGYWCGQLKIRRVYHRKVWELCYVLQALDEQGLLQPGKRGLGFACGEEPLPSLFASRGVEVVATDLNPDKAESAGWRKTKQHMTALDSIYRPELVDRSTLEKLVRVEFVDMNKIPEQLRDFDFCWSVCSLEHIGSIQKGLDFIENSLQTIKPGGFAVHTTEFNFGDDVKTIDNWGTVLFQRRHFTAIAKKLRDKGHVVAELNFDIGSKPMDQFIDIPPYSHDYKGLIKEHWSGGNWCCGQSQLKLSIDGFLCTCFGLIIQRAAK